MTSAEFATALLAPDAPLPAGVTDPLGRAAPRRFAVSRNNVVVSLTKALEDAFPVIRQLVGPEFFAAMAGVFLRAHPPQSPVLMLYGAGFAGFLNDFPPVAHLPYLADVARLEQALRESYHAADAPPVGGETLGQIGIEALMQRRLRLAPSLRLVASAFPIVSIWQANRQGGATPLPRPETALILRPGFDPMPHLLPPCGQPIITAIQAGTPLGAALSAAPEDEAAQVLSLLLTGQAIVEILP
ncbi:HvfC/BufC N-terminal domain-containing protein [Pseudotabrizicola sp. L79]|uniref:HvfC/BufC N-terminal domain-containing protein n=1 Tax=Pseudotabrizicola sp. L79 TaxID=3118402 RepID=UPI002F94994D